MTGKCVPTVQPTLPRTGASTHNAAIRADSAAGQGWALDNYESGGFRAQPAILTLDRGYAICTEARSGSSYLCDILKTTGILGNPDEYFNTYCMTVTRGIADYPADPEGQFAAMKHRMATPNGVYGLKVFSGHFDNAQITQWTERLPDLHFIHLVRLDVLAQAISHVRAWQTMQWTHGAAKRSEPVYDFDRINLEVKRLLKSQNRWRYYFARNSAPVLHLNYEQVCEDPQGAADRVARLIGLGETPKVDPDRIALSIQRDAINDEWRARYIATAGSLAVFD